MLRHKGAEFRLYGGEAVPAPLKGDRPKGRQPEARGFSRVRLHNDEQSRLFLKEKGIGGKSIPLPFMLAESATPDVQEIICVADEYCIAENVRAFIESAKSVEEK